MNGYNYKIVVIGNSAVGKTSILFRLSDNLYKDNFIPTLGLDCKSHAITVGDDKIDLTLWDTAGQERYRTITRNYYHDADGIIFTYSITDSQSFNDIGKSNFKIESWIRQTQDYAPKM